MGAEARQGAPAWEIGVVAFEISRMIKEEIKQGKDWVPGSSVYLVHPLLRGCCGSLLVTGGQLCKGLVKISLSFGFHRKTLAVNQCWQ